MIQKIKRFFERQSLLKRKDSILSELKYEIKVHVEDDDTDFVYVLFKDDRRDYKDGKHGLLMFQWKDKKIANIKDLKRKIKWRCREHLLDWLCEQRKKGSLEMNYFVEDCIFYLDRIEAELGNLFT